LSPRRGKNDSKNGGKNGKQKRQSHDGSHFDLDRAVFFLLASRFSKRRLFLAHGEPSPSVNAPIPGSVSMMSLRRFMFRKRRRGGKTQSLE
jgi:hypothetical protein